MSAPMRHATWNAIAYLANATNACPRFVNACDWHPRFVNACDWQRADEHDGGAWCGNDAWALLHNDGESLPTCPTCAVFVDLALEARS